MILRTGTATLGMSLMGISSMQAAIPVSESAKTKKVLVFSKSAGFEHDAFKFGKDGSPGFGQKLLAELGPKHGIDFTFSKDGSLFNAEYLAQFDAYFFYTTGDLTAATGDKNPGMTPEGKQAFLDAIKNGKGFIGSHCATDTFHLNEIASAHDEENRYKNHGDKADPYIRMIGGEFIHHGKQQPSTMRIADTTFPGLPEGKTEFSFAEEWYSLKDFSKDLHVILVQETKGMEGEPYQRPAYPATWARHHGKGRVFYTSMGHRPDVWTNPIFQDLLFGGIAWAVKNVEAKIPANIMQVTPLCMEIPPQAPPKAPKAPAVPAAPAAPQVPAIPK